MDAKYFAEIKARDSAELPETAAPVFRDRHALIIEVERLNRLLAEVKENQLDPVEMAKVGMALNRGLELQAENATLKRALEIACEDQTEHCPYTLHGGKRVCSEYPMRGLCCQDCAPKYYIHQAQEQEGQK